MTKQEATKKIFDGLYRDWNDYLYSDDGIKEIEEDVTEDYTIEEQLIDVIAGCWEMTMGSTNIGDSGETAFSLAEMVGFTHKECYEVCKEVAKLLAKEYSEK